MKRMLINATQPEELRVAVADGQQLLDLDIEVPAQEQKKSNIYKGRITRVEPSLEACFVEFGSQRHGFLPLKEISREYYAKNVRNKDGKVPIREAVKEGQEIIIQVEKEERGNKGAALTTFISLAGRYLVLMPNNPSAGGVSRRITGDDRQHLREQLAQVTSPDNVGIIVRTAGVGREAEELQWDLDYLVQLWDSITKAATERKAPFLIYQESNLFIRALRDHLRKDIGEILVDDEKVYQDASEFMQSVMPHNLRKLKLYQDQVPLFSRYQIESQIESAFARTVHLPSGGSVVFDPTEALLSIDINSARATKGSDIEETAHRTNLEAAAEIARQLRLRDLGGLIVIDFIDMMDRRNQRSVENRLRESLQLDKARVQTGKISRFGLLEMSRQRLRPSLGESTQLICPRCDGQGHIRSVESLALSILRLSEEEAMKEYTGQVIVQAPTKVANFLLNEKRSALNDIEARHKVSIVLLGNENMVTPAFEILRVRKSEVSDDPSYSHVEAPAPELVANAETQAKAQVAAVQAVAPPKPAPARPAAPESDASSKKDSGFLARLGKMLFASGDSTEESEAPAEKAPQSKGKKAPSKARSQQGGSKKTTRKTGKKTGQRKATGQKQGSAAGEEQENTRSRSRSRSRSRNRRKKAGTATATAGAATQTNAANVSSDVKPADPQSAEGGEKKTKRRRSRGRRGGRGRNKAASAATAAGTADASVSQADSTPTETQQAPVSNNKTAQAPEQPAASAETNLAPIDRAFQKKAEKEASEDSKPAPKKKAPRRKAPAKKAPTKDSPSVASADNPSTSGEQKAADKAAPTAAKPTAEKATEKAASVTAKDGAKEQPADVTKRDSKPAAPAASSTTPTRETDADTAGADKADTPKPATAKAPKAKAPKAKAGQDKPAPEAPASADEAGTAKAQPKAASAKKKVSKKVGKKTAKKTASKADTKAEPDAKTKGIYTLSSASEDKPAAKD